MTLTFIGYGKMAKAIIKGVYTKYKIEVVGRDDNKLKELKKEFSEIEIFNIDGFDIENRNIILAVKPFAVEEVSQKLKGEANLILSILAGTKIESLKEKFRSKSFIRVMPNIAASNSASMTTLTGDIEFKLQALDICNSFGNSLWLNSEKELDIATAVAGSGPAYLAIVAEAIADGAVKCGLKREDASSITKGLFSGFATLIDLEHPALIKDAVMSPGGTTAAGCFALENEGVRVAFMKAVEDAYKKALSID